MPSVEPIALVAIELRDWAPEEAQEASYFAASARMASLSRTVCTLPPVSPLFLSIGDAGASLGAIKGWRAPRRSRRLIGLEPKRLYPVAIPFWSYSMVNRLGGGASAACVLFACVGCCCGFCIMVWILVAASYSDAAWSATALSLSIAVSLLSTLASLLICPSQAAPEPRQAYARCSAGTRINEIARGLAVENSRQPRD
jgi:hypothetical protein